MNKICSCGKWQESMQYLNPLTFSFCPFCGSNLEQNYFEYLARIKDKINLDNWTRNGITLRQMIKEKNKPLIVMTIRQYYNSVALSDASDIAQSLIDMFKPVE